MKNTLLFGVVGLVLVAGGVGGYTYWRQSNQTMTKTEVMEKTEPMVKSEDAMVEETKTMVPSGMMQKSGKYQPFSPELLSSTATTRRVLFFYANWCPTCKPADQSFSENSSKIPADVTLIRVNYNDPDTDQAEKDLAKKYGVTYQHTFIQIDATGQVVTKWNGGQIDELLSNLK